MLYLKVDKVLNQHKSYTQKNSGINQTYIKKISTLITNKRNLEDKNIGEVNEILTNKLLQSGKEVVKITYKNEN